MEEQIVNRVAGSSLVSIDLEEFLDKNPRVFLDLKDTLYQGMVLREKDFREFVRDHDWDQYQGLNVAVGCSIDAIIPAWAYMMVAGKLAFIANVFALGGEEELEKTMIDQAIDKIAKRELKDAKIVIKGCGNIQNRDYAYFRLAQRLIPLVSSLMYGEPCSTVPVYKRKR